MSDISRDLPAHASTKTGSGDDMVRELCDLLGYGFVMNSAARQWAEMDPIGAFTIGPPSGFKSETSRTSDQQAAIDGPPPQGYGAIIEVDGSGMPDWIDPQEIVARHLPMGLSERKAASVVTWCHPFRVRADHPYYSCSMDYWVDARNT